MWLERVHSLLQMLPARLGLLSNRGLLAGQDLYTCMLVFMLCLQENADSMLTQLEAQKKAVDQLLGNTR